MEETIMFPSPNWFQAANLSVSKDNWLVYGGPNKSLCILEPLPEDSNRIVQGDQGYHLHFVSRAHPDKIVSLDLHPSWPEKRALLAGSQDGLVKQWVLEQGERALSVRSNHCHEVHSHNKEEVVGVGYCKDSYAVTVGSYGHVVKWDLQSNVVRSQKVLKGFRPNAVACSPHVHLNVAVGTKQGVVFVLDLNGAFRILYKVRGQDDEITQLAWCPQYEVAVRKVLKDAPEPKPETRTAADQRMDRIRQQPEDPDVEQALDKRVQESATEDMPVLINERLEAIKLNEEAIEATEPNSAAITEEITDVVTEAKNTTEKMSDVDAKNTAAETTDVINDAKNTTADIKETIDVVIDAKNTTADIKEKTHVVNDAKNTTADTNNTSAGTTDAKNTTLDTNKTSYAAQGAIQEATTSTSRDTLTMNKEVLNASGTAKTLPEDSFDETIVVEDDMFDIYQDHAADEFGHKKYEPEDIRVKVKAETEQNDYLAECQKLKDDILKRKNESEKTIDSLVTALDKTHVGLEVSETTMTDVNKIPAGLGSTYTTDTTADTQKLDALNWRGEAGPSQDMTKGKITKGELQSSVHIHKHLLATIGKNGSVRVWSKSGKMVGSCHVQGPSKNRNQRGGGGGTNWTTLLWYQPEVLLLSDSRSQLLQCNPLLIDSKNKLEYKVVHTIHKRGIFTIASNAPRVQPIDIAPDLRDSWPIWTTSMDRMMLCYSMKTRSVVAEYQTCGGNLYMVKPCPYDARKIAVSVGDGVVRIWETETTEDETKLTRGEVAGYWQNVLGKVLTVAWHPTREGLLAFSTAESRVGLITSGKGKTDKPAKVLPSALSGAIYAISWGAGSALYACGSGSELVRYNADTPDEAPMTIPVNFEGQKWSLTSVQWFPQGLVVGSDHGGVAILDGNYEIITAAFAATKMIHNVDWHPQQTSSSDDESPLKNLLAVSSLDKSNNIVILELTTNEEQEKQLSSWKVLSGHTGIVLKVEWSPHVDELLLSTSQDSTVRVWSAVEGTCLSIFGGHSQSALAAAWSPFPQLASTVISGGGDYSLRLWDYTQHPAHLYQDHKRDIKKDKKKPTKPGDKKPEGEQAQDEVKVEDETTAAAQLDAKIKASKKFLLPSIFRDLYPCKIEAVLWIFSLYCKTYTLTDLEDISGYDKMTEAKVIRLFGNNKELGELLDDEAERHQDTGNLDAWFLLQIVRGYMDAAYSYAIDKDLLDPFLLSIAPCVSFKYWKEVTIQYVAQIDRLAAKGLEARLSEVKVYGGPVFRKVGTLLSLHDVAGAVTVLVEAGLFLEAYVLCRARYVEELTMRTLEQWARSCETNGNLNLAAVCYISLGDPVKAATVLGKSSNESSLYAAGTIARIMGQNAFSKLCFERSEEQAKAQPKEEALDALPTRAEAILKRDNEGIKADADVIVKNEDKGNTEGIKEGEAVLKKEDEGNTEGIKEGEAILKNDNEDNVKGLKMEDENTNVLQNGNQTEQDTKEMKVNGDKQVTENGFKLTEAALAEGSKKQTKEKSDGKDIKHDSEEKSTTDINKPDTAEASSANKPSDGASPQKCGVFKYSDYKVKETILTNIQTNVERLKEERDSRGDDLQHLEQLYTKYMAPGGGDTSSPKEAGEQVKVIDEAGDA